MNWEVDISRKNKSCWTIFPQLCKGCGLCIIKCPKKCLKWSQDLGVYGTPRVKVNVNECIFCGICSIVCPDCAIKVEK